jgi:hypothetical protein
MTNYQAVELLVREGLEFQSKIGNCIVEVIRLDADSERGKEEINSLIEKLDYTVDNFKNVLKLYK